MLTDCVMMPPLSPPMSMLWIRVLSADHVKLKNAHICKPPAFSNSPTLKLGARGGEPTYAKVIAACPKAALNPKTKRPFSKSTVYLIFQEDCYDDAPFLPWVCKARFSKTALTHGMMERRLKFADYVSALRHNNAWFFHNGGFEMGSFLMHVPITGTGNRAFSFAHTQ